MLSFVIRRLLWLPVTLLSALVLIFILMNALPGDPVSVMVGPRATPEMRKAVEEKMHLDESIPIQLVYFIKNLLHGDLGTSVLDGRPVIDYIKNALPNTAMLAFCSLFLAIIIGIPLGALSAIHKNSVTDYTIMILSYFVVSMPDYVSGCLLILIFAVKIDLFPASGLGVGTFDQIHHLILPTIALSLPWIGYIARIVRGTMLEVLDAPYIKMEKSFGFPLKFIWAKYALRNAITPAIAALGVMVGKLLGGAVLIETIFTRPGLGRLVAESVAARNIPVIQGTVIVTATFFIFSNLIADISYMFVDPRIRYEK